MYRKLATIMAASAFFFTGSALAMSFDSVDKDSNGQISKQEFVQSKLFKRWDNNNDGKLKKGEAAQDFSELTDWDTDDTGYLDDNEFYDGAWSEWDADDNDYLDNDEWDDAGEYGWYDV